MPLKTVLAETATRILDGADVTNRTWCFDFIQRSLTVAYVNNFHIWRILEGTRRDNEIEEYIKDRGVLCGCLVFRFLEAEYKSYLPKVSKEVFDPIWEEIRRDSQGFCIKSAEQLDENPVIIDAFTFATNGCEQMDPDYQMEIMLPGLLVYQALARQVSADDLKELLG